LGEIAGEGTAEAGAVALRGTEVTMSARMAAAEVTAAVEAITQNATTTGPGGLEAGAPAGEVAGAEAPVEEGETGAPLGKAVQREGLKSSNGTGKKNKENRATRATTIILTIALTMALRRTENGIMNLKSRSMLVVTMID